MSPNSYGVCGSEDENTKGQENISYVEWTAEDIITSTIDLDEEEAVFYRNGFKVGKTFKALKGKNLAYFPAISLGVHERAKFNFGKLPFIYGLEVLRQGDF
jgi:hypothetical protein